MKYRAADLARRLGITQYSPDGNYSTLCPAHHDENPSCSFKDGDHEVMFNCFAGCSHAEVKVAMAARVGGHADDFVFERDRPADTRVIPPDESSDQEPTATPGSDVRLTLAAFAEAKGFPLAFLTRRGIREDKDGLVLAYHYQDGSLAPRHRRRTALRAIGGSTWTGKKGEPLVPYGLTCLALARTTGHLIVTEGETDQLSAVYHDMPAIGIPGATQTKLISADLLDGITHLWVTQDPDDAGVAFVQDLAQRLRQLKWVGEAKAVQMPEGMKDLNDLHRLAGIAFPRRGHGAASRPNPCPHRRCLPTCARSC